MKQDFDIHSEQIAKNAYLAILRNWESVKTDKQVLRVSLTVSKKKRTNPQNSLYWVLVTNVSQSFWLDNKQFSEESIHELFKRMFLPNECAKKDKNGNKIQKWIDVPFGERRLNMSTTDLDVSEFSEYFTKVEAYVVGELGVLT